MKKSDLFPLILLTLLPLWYVSKNLHGDLLSFLNLLYSGGSYALSAEIFSFHGTSLFIGILFYFFIKYLSPKASLLLSSFILTSLYYCLFTPSFFFDHLNVFITVAALSFRSKDHCKHLFYSLYFITLLHTLSSLLTCIYFYKYNIPLLLIIPAPMLSLWLLQSKDVYPSRTTLASLFPLLLLPITYFTHAPSEINLGNILGALLLITSVYALLEKRSYRTLSTLLSLSALPLCFLTKSGAFPFLFTPISLMIGIMQLFYSSRRPRPSRASVLQLPTQPSLPPLHFYNEHMHY